MTANDSHPGASTHPPDDPALVWPGCADDQPVAAARRRTATLVRCGRPAGGHRRPGEVAVTAPPARAHSGKPSSRRRASNPWRRRVTTARSA